MATRPRGVALLAPSRGAAFITGLVLGDHVVSGAAPVTLPAGWAHGLPVGIVLFGTRWSDPP
jgi:amidase